MIYEADRNPGENEVTCYTVAVGNAPMPWSSRKVKKAAKAAMEYIATLEGLVGVNPQPPRGTLCLFRTLNDAKAAKNLMDAKGIKTGDNICAVFVDKKYLQE